MFPRFIHSFRSAQFDDYFYSSAVEGLNASICFGRFSAALVFQCRLGSCDEYLEALLKPLLWQQETSVGSMAAFMLANPICSRQVILPIE
jgi:predicted membrane protein